MDENNINVTPEAEGQDTATAKTYTQEEVDALLQQETDRRVTSALKKAEEKNNRKVREAEKLAAMNAQQRYEYELEQREAELNEKERRLTLAENTAEASKILGEKGLDQALVELVVADDANTMSDNIAKLEKAFKKSVKEEVERRLGSATPKKNLPPDEAITREKFAKMSIREMQELYNTNPELYKTLTTQKG